MQFQIICKHCHRSFVITSDGGKTLKCNCPYCGTESTIAVPLLETKKVEQKKQTLQVSSIGKKATICFLIFVGIMLITSTFLYILFTVISN